jgi:hypothetical protein
MTRLTEFVNFQRARRADKNNLRSMYALASRWPALLSETEFENEEWHGSGPGELERRLETVAAAMDADPSNDYQHHVALEMEMEMASSPTSWEADAE